MLKIKLFYFFLRRNVYFRWHWYDNNDDDVNNNNTSNSSEDIISITISIIVSINRFIALSHIKLLIFGRFCVVEHSVKTAHLSNSLDKRLQGQSLPGRILALFLCYYFSCPICPTSLWRFCYPLSLSVFSRPRSEDWPGMIFFSKQFLALWSGAQSISTTQSLVFIDDYNTLHICPSPFILKALFCY